MAQEGVAPAAKRSRSRSPYDGRKSERKSSLERRRESRRIVRVPPRKTRPSSRERNGDGDDDDDRHHGGSDGSALERAMKDLTKLRKVVDIYADITKWSPALVATLAEGGEAAINDYGDKLVVECANAIHPPNKRHACDDQSAYDYVIDRLDHYGGWYGSGFLPNITRFKGQYDLVKRRAPIVAAQYKRLRDMPVVPHIPDADGNCTICKLRVGGGKTIYENAQEAKRISEMNARIAAMRTSRAT